MHINDTHREAGVLADCFFVLFFVSGLSALGILYCEVECHPRSATGTIQSVALDWALIGPQRGSVALEINQWRDAPYRLGGKELWLLTIIYHICFAPEYFTVELTITPLIPNQLTSTSRL